MTNSKSIKAIFTILSLWLVSCSKEEPIVSPTVITTEATSIQQKSVKIYGEVTDDGFSSILEKGFYISKTSNSNDKKISLGTGKGKFEITVDSLTPNTKYYFKSFAKNSKGESLGQVLNFTTLDFKAATLSTDMPQNISYYSVLLSGTLNDDGGGTIKEKGFCMSTNPNPSIKDLKFPIDKAGNAMSLVVIKLLENTTYYYKAYSINEKGESYGNEQSFKTLKTTLPKVGTAPASDITQTSVKLSGLIIDDGGFDIIEKGICYSINNTPTIKDNKVSLGAGNTSFTANLATLPVNSNLYYRAYATNSLGISYGEILSFKLLYTKALTVITSPITKKNSNDFAWNFGGELNDDGGFPIEDVGVVISDKSNPTLTDNIYRKSYQQEYVDAKRNFGNIPFLFSTNPNYVQLDDRTIATSKTYYIRAYANNSKERVYGNEIVYTAEPTIMEKGGGYIGYIYQKGDVGYVEGEEHGIIVAKTLFAGTPWGCTGTNILGAERKELGSGTLNTNDIVKDCPSALTPASICDKLELNGYSDWVLPSLDDLRMIIRWRRDRVPTLSTQPGLWSSTEYNADNAYGVSVKDIGYYGFGNKNGASQFIAIRYY